jgi:hypothetical protein
LSVIGELEAYRNARKDVVDEIHVQIKASILRKTWRWLHEDSSTVLNNNSLSRRFMYKVTQFDKAKATKRASGGQFLSSVHVSVRRF